MSLAEKRKKKKSLEQSVVINKKSKLARKLYDNLPFELTDDQKKVIREIMSDMESGKPMNRLLQGDVGSGKTIVALLTMLSVIDDGYQVAIMAPTEILAEQHYHSIKKFTGDLDVNIIELTGGQRKKYRREVLEAIASGEADIIVGTHAMFESSVEYKNLAYIVIDEQHRFGVDQRADLIKRAKSSLPEDKVPHILVMSATPIPRTLSLTLYGDLDVSVIRQMPANRKPIKTKIVFDSEIDKVYDFIRKRVSEGEQAYIVYPLVEKSQKMELKSAVEFYEKLNNDIFPDLKCGLLHGQMFWYEKEEMMRAFLDKKYDILVATTVIEVGIDVPNVTIMVIEDAERFGLSQLHQLRGRVGRSDKQSYCLLVTKDKFSYELKRKDKNEMEKMAAIVRLRTMEATTDGFEIAEVDLKLRGPGDLMGTRQSGIPDFRFIDLTSDLDIISVARNEAINLIERDPELNLPEHKIVKYYMYFFQGLQNYYDIA
jgi:ATP-dependent DNA helicase RecG